MKPLSWAEESEIEGKRVLFFTFRVLGEYFQFFFMRKMVLKKKLLNQFICKIREEMNISEHFLVRDFIRGVLFRIKYS